MRISVSARVIAMMRKRVEISFGYHGDPPVRSPRTRPVTTISGKLRHGRNAAGT